MHTMLNLKNKNNYLKSITHGTRNKLNTQTIKIQKELWNVKIDMNKTQI